MDLTFLNSRNESVYVRSDLLIVAEHTGTHLDAPGHFSKTAWDNFEIPPERYSKPSFPSSYRHAHYFKTQALGEFI